MSFDTAIEGLLAREGGYVNHPADRGGATNFGVTERVARDHGYAGDMRSLPRAKAIAIYKARYWTPLRLDEVSALAPKTAEKIFDIAVNMGPARAARMLQQAINYFQGGVSVDGQIGPATLRALSDFVRRRGDGADRNLVKIVNGLQAARYVGIVEGDASQRAFAYGWADGRLS